MRAITGNSDASARLALRRGVPNSPLAGGVSGSFNHYAPYVYLSATFRSWEGHVFDQIYLEHKNVLGLTVRAQVTNLLNAARRRDR